MWFEVGLSVQPNEWRSLIAALASAVRPPQHVGLYGGTFRDIGPTALALLWFLRGTLDGPATQETDF